MFDTSKTDEMTKGSALYLSVPFLANGVLTLRFKVPERWLEGVQANKELLQNFRDSMICVRIDYTNNFQLLLRLYLLAFSACQIHQTQGRISARAFCDHFFRIYIYIVICD
jgi:hypothetical protein